MFVSFDGGSGRKCAIDFLLSFGFLPKEAVYDCFFFKLKYAPFVGEPLAEQRRLALLRAHAEDVNVLVRCCSICGCLCCGLQRRRLQGCCGGRPCALPMLVTAAAARVHHSLRRCPPVPAE